MRVSNGEGAIYLGKANAGYIKNCVFATTQEDAHGDLDSDDFVISGNTYEAEF